MSGETIIIRRRIPRLTPPLPVVVRVISDPEPLEVRYVDKGRLDRQREDDPTIYVFYRERNPNGSWGPKRHESAEVFDVRYFNGEIRIVNEDDYARNRPNV